MKGVEPREPSQMNIHLTPEQEKILREELESGHFPTARK
jgi:hypothetical protein